MPAATPPDYRVELETFRGPLDLLLYLVKRDEIDVRDIPIARVAEQFKSYLDVLSLIDVEGAGDFLVMAATLMEIKSKMLLPRPEGEEGEEEDPRMGLVRQLLQYKQFKDAAVRLEELAEQQATRLPRQPPPAPTPAGAPPLRPVELWDLVSAFGRLMRETLATRPHEIVVDQTPLHVYMDAVLTRLQEEGPLSLSALFTPPHTRGRLVGLFLAVLELSKGRRIVPEQPGLFGDILVKLAPPPESLPAEPSSESPPAEPPPPEAPAVENAS
jgi:segregation and condensation protein A